MPDSGPDVRLSEVATASVLTPSRSQPRFSVIIPTIGREASLVTALRALVAQTYPRSRFEILVAFDGIAPSVGLEGECANAGAQIVPLKRRLGPGAARNAAARMARGDILAFTEDDCVVDADWLTRAAKRFEQDPALEVLDGLTVYPNGRPKPRGAGDVPVYLPTNLFVERARFTEAGGYCEDFFDPRSGIYFREDSDFGFSLEARRAKIARDASVRVTHPEELTRFLDPIRWARRFVMDPLLARRHPRRFRDRIEVVTFGPLRVRRPFVRACMLYTVGVVVAFVGFVGAMAPLIFGGIAIVVTAAFAIWAKWRFDLRRLPVVPFVAFVLLLSLLEGEHRARRIATRRAAADDAATTSDLDE